VDEGRKGKDRTHRGDMNRGNMNRGRSSGKGREGPWAWRIAGGTLKNSGGSGRRHAWVCYCTIIG
jgi:hypothetical protein